jgi:hypothetical protein
LELNILTFSSTPIDKYVPGYVLLHLLWTASDILEYCFNNENVLSHRLSNLTKNKQTSFSFFIHVCTRQTLIWITSELASRHFTSQGHIIFTLNQLVFTP